MTSPPHASALMWRSSISRAASPLLSVMFDNGKSTITPGWTTVWPNPAPPAGAPQGQSVAGRGPRRDGDVSVRYGSPGSAELQARRDILLTPQLIADDKDAVADGA